MIRIRDTIESTAVCGPNFGWAYNKEGLSPCLLSAAVLAPCQQGSWITQPLNASYHYDPPEKVKGTLNECSCSWAAYNLMMACTACQGQSSSVSTWPFYRAECDGAGLLSHTTYWPSDVMIPSNHKIPFYAGHDPDQWTDQTFNVGEAQQIANTNNPDLGVPTESTPHKSTPIGAIVGGTIGGVVFVLALLLLCICRRRRRLGVQEFPPRRPSMFSSISGDTADSRRRIMSVASISSFGSVMSSQPHSPNTMYTYDGTMQSFSQFGAPSVYTTHPQTSVSHQHMSRVMSPAPTVQTITPGPVDHIQPFTLMSPDDSPDTLAHRRKEAAARGISPTQVQSVPSTIVTLPVQPQTAVVPEQQRTPEQVRHLRGVLEEEEHQPRMTRDRSQSQPPAYDSLIPTPSETASSYDHAVLLRERNGHAHRTHESPPEKGSQDTQTSAWTSFGGVTDSTIHAIAIASEEPARLNEEEVQTPQVDPGRSARYRSVQSTVESQSRDHPDVVVA